MRENIMNYQRNFKNEDGTEETIIITSNDNHMIDLRQNYKLANNCCKKDNKLFRKFKNSILGADIGIRSSGFSNVAILSVIIAMGTFLIMYLLWRF